MKHLKLSFVMGLALFALFFGAGNVTFPLFIGAHAGNQLIYAIIGFVLTGILMPLFGLIVLFLKRGDFFKIFHFMPKRLAMSLLGIVMVILGPLVGIPRCLSLINALVVAYVPPLLHLPFIIPLVICCAAFFLVIERSTLIDKIGKILSPVKILVLLAVIIVGLLTAKGIVIGGIVHMSTAGMAIDMGYNTMDLLAAVFFANMIYLHLDAKLKDRKDVTHKTKVGICIKASLICYGLLAVVYSLFAVVAAGHAAVLVHAPMASIIEVLASQVLGPVGGILVTSAVILACFVTSVALLTVSSDFLHQHILKSKVRYSRCVLLMTLVSLGISQIGFAAIVAFASTVLGVVYPIVIMAICISLVSMWKPGLQQQVTALLPSRNILPTLRNKQEKS